MNKGLVVVIIVAIVAVIAIVVIKKLQQKKAKKEAENVAKGLSAVLQGLEALKTGLGNIAQKEGTIGKTGAYVDMNAPDYRGMPPMPEMPLQ